jgi:hypothetical protein
MTEDDSLDKIESMHGIVEISLSRLLSVPTSSGITRRQKAFVSHQAIVPRTQILYYYHREETWERHFLENR